jgi:hypothetical protein
MTITFPCKLPEYTSLVGTCSKTCDYMKALMISIRSCNVLKGDPTIDGVNIPNPFIRITPNISELNGRAYIKKDSKQYFLDSINLFYTPMHGFVDATDLSSELQLFFKFNQEYIIISVPVQTGSSGISVPFFRNIIDSIKKLEKSMDDLSIPIDNVDTSSSNIQIQDLIPTNDNFYYYEPTVYNDQFGNDDSYTPYSPPKAVYVYTSPLYIDSESMNYIKGQTTNTYTQHSIDYNSIFFHEHNDNSESVQSGALAGTVGNDIFIDCGNTDYDDKTIGPQTSTNQENTYYIFLLSIILIVFPILSYTLRDATAFNLYAPLLIILFGIIYIIFFSASKKTSITSSVSIINMVITGVSIVYFIWAALTTSKEEEEEES